MTPAYDTLWIGIMPEKDVLRKRIAERLHARMKQGMVHEARHLHTGGLSFKRMESFGLEYRALAHFLQGRISRADMLSQLDSDIWRYAKRQRTYWRRNNAIKWFKPSQKRALVGAVRSWLTN